MYGWQISTKTIYFDKLNYFDNEHECMDINHFVSIWFIIIIIIRFDNLMICKDDYLLQCYCDSCTDKLNYVKYNDKILLNM